MPLKHPHVTFVSYAVDISNTSMVDVMVLETTLHLNSRHPEYDRAAVASLIEAARAYLLTNASHVTRIRLTTTRSGEI